MKILQLLVIETFVIFTHTFGSPSIDWCQGTRIEDDLYADVLRGIYPSNLNETFILRRINNYNSFFPCVSECCGNSKCNVAFMFSQMCLLFSCPSFKNSSCQPLKKKNGADDEDEDIDTYWITVRSENDYELELAELAHKFENITSTYDNNNHSSTYSIKTSSFSPTTTTITTKHFKITSTTSTTSNISNPTTTTSNILNPTTTANILKLTTTTANILKLTTTTANILKLTTTTTTTSNIITPILTYKITIVINQTNSKNNNNKKRINVKNNKIINNKDNKTNTSKSNNTICGYTFMSNPFKLGPNCDWKIANVVFCLVIIIILSLLSVCCIVCQCQRYCNKDEIQYRALYNRRKTPRNKPVYYGFYSEDENEEDDDDEDELLVRRHLIEMVNSKRVMSQENGVEESGDVLDGDNVSVERVAGMGSLSGRRKKSGVGISGSLGSRRFNSKNRNYFGKK